MTLSLCACGSETSPPHVAPAKAEAVTHESDVLKLTLTEDAVRRLGIRTVHVSDGSADAVREAAGEVVVPPIAGGLPIGAGGNLAQIATSQAIADGEIARTAALARLAQIAFTRADALVRAEAGSMRARDEAAANLATARAAADAARAQRQLLGPTVRAMARQSTLWVRVPLSGSDVVDIARGRPASVRPLADDKAAPRLARPVAAPPSADAVAGTVDLYYALDNRDRAWRVGQRIAVALPVGGATAGLSVPTAAIVRDIYGGEWVYRQTAPTTFVRQRIEVASAAGGRALLTRGLERGAAVVTDGAAELFGTEFGTPH